MLIQNIHIMKSRRKEERGFTLVESMIYIALLVVLFAGIVQAVILLSSSYRNVKTVRSIESSAIMAIDRMNREIRNAISVNTAQTTYNSSPGSLALVSFDSDGDPLAIRFYISNQRLMLEENGVSLGPLTSADTAVTSLIFRSFSTTTSSAVKIELQLANASTSSYAITKNFYTTAVLRGSY